MSASPETIPSQPVPNGLTSNIAGVAIHRYTPTQSATFKPTIASVPEATTHWLTGIMAEHPLTKDMEQCPHENDAAIRESIESALAHIFAGQAESWTPSHERMAIVHEVMDQARHFRETLRANPQLTIAHLENMIGPHSALSHQHKERVAKHHPDHPHNKMLAQQAANDSHAATNVHLHPTNPHHTLMGGSHNHHHDGMLMGTPHPELNTATH